jgi:hypothetical protein
MSGRLVLRAVLFLASLSALWLVVGAPGVVGF